MVAVRWYLRYGPFRPRCQRTCRPNVVSRSTTSPSTAVVGSAAKCVSARRAEVVGERTQPGHLLREQHQGGRGRSQRRDRNVQRVDAVRGHPRARVRRPCPGQSVRCRILRLRQQHIGQQRRGYDDGRERADFRAGVTGGLFSAAGTTFTNRSGGVESTTSPCTGAGVHSAVGRRCPLRQPLAWRSMVRRREQRQGRRCLALRLPRDRSAPADHRRARLSPPRRFFRRAPGAMKR